jgi:hypothetical protein
MKKLGFMLLLAFQTLACVTLSASYQEKHYDRFTVPVPTDRLIATVEVLSGIFTAPSGSTVTPFVSTPDGFVQQGSPILISNLPAQLTFPAVIPVVTGNYVYGILVTGSGISAYGDTLPVTINSLATGVSSITNIFIPYVTLTTTQSQFNASFVYNAPSFP